MNPVFARCAESVDQGRRLENLSWRLWTRETFCCEGGQGVAPSATTLPKQIIHARGSSSTTDEIPQLSGSVDSVADEEAVEFTSESAPLEILRPRIQRQDSCASSRSRGKERHITSDDLEKMVVSIVRAKEPLNAPLPEILHAAPLSLADKIPSPPQLERSGSTTTESPCKSSETPSLDSLQQAHSPEMPSSEKHTMVVRGFSPSQIPVTSVTSQPTESPSPSAIPAPEEAPAPKIVQPKKQQAVFALGGSSGEDSYSDPSPRLETRKQPIAAPKMFEVGISSGEESSLKSALHSSKSGSLITSQKKTASFSDKVVTRTFPASAVVDDESDTDYVDESAIDDDDDSSEWEDSLEDSGKSSMDDKVTFRRDNSKANLTSRRSLITLMLAQNDRAQKLGNVASQSTSAIPRARASRHAHSLMASPSDSDESPLEMKRTLRPPPMRSINEIPRSAAQPIVTATHGVNHQAALSPRTTRRNMLATELTESLRRHLLWERSQKTSTVNAVLKRRHTSQDVANLKQYPDKPYMKKDDDDVNASSWDQYLNKEAFNGYHSKGW